MTISLESSSVSVKICVDGVADYLDAVAMSILVSLA